MHKKMQCFIVIIISYTTFGFIFGMEEYQSITGQLQRSEIEQLLKEGLISSLAINDYIIPVTTFSHALKKEVVLARTCLVHMKRMWSKKIGKHNRTKRMIMCQHEKNVYILNDVKEYGDETYNYLRNFYSKNIIIAYGENNVRMRIQPIVYFVSPCNFSFKNLSMIDFVVPHLSDSLQREWDTMLTRKESYTFELVSQGNISYWLKVGRTQKNALLKD